MADMHQHFVDHDSQQENINEIDDARPVDHIPQNRRKLFDNRVHSIPSQHHFSIVLLYTIEKRYDRGNCTQSGYFFTPFHWLCLHCGKGLNL